MNLRVSLIALVAAEQLAIRMGLKVIRFTDSFMACGAVVASFSNVDLLVPIEVGHLLESLAASATAERPVARVHQVMSVQVGDTGEGPGAKAAVQTPLALFCFFGFTFIRRELGVKAF